ncbi:MAG TPA: MaoC family dehydratase [Actinomycetota bacterium]|nr:MaoC family dehydratase [Actinomycetota bacterium]
MSIVEKLKPLEGRELGVGEWMEITQERINAFAGATDDHQWIHVDPEAAAKGPFGKTIAHGYLTLSLIPALAGSMTLPVEGIKMGINYGLNRVRFIAPVPVGSRIRARRKMQEVREVPGGAQLTVEVTIELEGSEKPACVAETVSRVYT